MKRIPKMFWVCLVWALLPLLQIPFSQIHPGAQQRIEKTESERFWQIEQIRFEKELEGTVREVWDAFIKAEMSRPRETPADAKRLFLLIDGKPVELPYTF
jgi:hypothetical protein